MVSNANVCVLNIHHPRVWVEGGFGDSGLEKKRRKKGSTYTQSFPLLPFFFKTRLSCHLCECFIPGTLIFILPQYPVISSVIVLSHSSVWIRQGPCLSGVYILWWKIYI